MEYKELKRLVELVKNAGITYLSIDENGTKVEIKKEHKEQTSVVLPQQPVAVPAPSSVPEVSQPSAPQASPKSTEDLIEIKAEMVGTFYAASNPESSPFVNVGDRVDKGTVICVIEAMKLFNEIESDVVGVVEEICVSNEQPVEFGQVLFRLRKG